jgi:hypothetical protein
MPTLTIPLAAEGAIVEVALLVSGPRQAALLAAGLPVPPTMLARAMIDTGASCTVIDPSVVKHLSLVPIGIAAVHSASTGGQPHSVNEFDIGFAIRDGTRLISSAPLHSCCGMRPQRTRRCNAAGLRRPHGRSVYVQRPGQVTDTGILMRDPAPSEFAHPYNRFEFSHR